MNPTKRVLGSLLAVAMGLALFALPAADAADAPVIVKQPQSVTIRPGEGFVLEVEIDGESSFNRAYIWYSRRGEGAWEPYQAAQTQTVDTPTSSKLVCQTVVDPYRTSVNDDQRFPSPATLFSAVTMEFYCDVYDYGATYTSAHAKSAAAGVTVKPGFTDYFKRLGSSPLFLLPQSIFVSLVTGPFALALLFFENLFG